MIKLTLFITAFFLGFSAHADNPNKLGTHEEIDAGKILYDAKCAQCHGMKGDGSGIATPFLKPAPRDFTRGTFKFRTTPSGELPIDDDIIRSIKKGMPYTGMPAWPELSDKEVRNLMYYLKTFNADFADPDYNNPSVVKLSKPPPYSDESAKQGRKVFEENDCVKCHGESGRGDGVSAPTMVDDWGHHIRPADLTKPWTFRSGPTREDIFRAFSTGLNGTPMPSFGDSIEESARWDLVNYIDSLSKSETPDYSPYLEVSPFDGDLDLSKGEIFKNASQAYFPIVGQVIEPGREFYPSANGIEVKAVYNSEEVAFMLSWHDMSADTTGQNSPDIKISDFDTSTSGAGSDPFAGGPVLGGGDEMPYSDAVAIQIPIELYPGVEKPYFIFGDGKHPVHLWFADLAKDHAELFEAQGSNSIKKFRGMISSTKKFENGRWTVAFKRARNSSKGVSFEEGTFVPIAFSIWDGFNKERGNKRGVSSWFYLYTRPGEEKSALVPALKSSMITLFVLGGIVFLVRRKFA